MTHIREGNMSFSKFLKYRSIWMALAILWIVFYHWGGAVHGSAIVNIKKIGYAGVDIFVFASGLGLYHSLNKGSLDLFDYAKRRLSRLLPPYGIYVIIWLLANAFLMKREITLPVISANLFGIAAFASVRGVNWYLGLLWLMYILAPFFFAIVRKCSKEYHYAMVFVLLLFMSLAFRGNYVWMLMATRIPTFFIGMVYGKKSTEKESLGKPLVIIAIILSLIGVAGEILCWKYMDETLLNEYGFTWYPLLLMAPGMCMLISLIAGWFDTCFLKGINRVLNVVGNNTFEILLIHLLVFDIFNTVWINEMQHEANLISWVICLIIIIPLTAVLHYAAVLVKKIL